MVHMVGVNICFTVEDGDDNIGGNNIEQGIE
jgi:hypothetical protein